MATIGTMVVGLVAKTTQFEQGMKRAQSSLGSFEKTVRALSPATARFFMLLKNGAIAGAAAYAVKGLADALTAASIATRKGESGMLAFAKTLPLVGGFVSSFHAAYLELSGINEQLEIATQKTAAMGSFSDIAQSVADKAATSTGNESTDKKNQASIDKRKQIEALDKAYQEYAKAASSAGYAEMSVFDEKLKAMKAINAEYERQVGMIESSAAAKQKERNAEYAYEHGGKQNEQAMSIQLDLMSRIDDMKRQQSGMSQFRSGLLMQMEQMGLGTKYTEDKDLLKIIDEYERIQKEMEVKPEIKKTTPGDASFREVRSSAVSVAGLSIGGTLDKQAETNRLLEEQNQLLRQMNANMVMN
jgi:hypothetical protein